MILPKDKTRIVDPLTGKVITPPGYTPPRLKKRTMKPGQEYRIPSWKIVFEDVAAGDITERFPVPGGWLYRNRFKDRMAIFFVPVAGVNERYRLDEEGDESSEPDEPSGA